LRTKMRLISEIAVLILIIFGLHLLGIFKINILYRDKRFHNVEKPRGMIGALVVGLAFAFGWTPCIGPILAGILTIASTKQTVTEGVFLLGIYSMCLGLALLMTGLGLLQCLSLSVRFNC